MNTAKTPTYLVYHSNPIAGPTRKFFTHENLLTARRAAMTYAESLFNTRLKEYLEQDEVEVWLVEITTPDDLAPAIIAHLMQKTAEDMNAAQYRRASNHKLLELQREFEYYQTNHHAIGFGAFGLTVTLDHQSSPVNHITILYEAAASALVALALYGGDRDIDFNYYYYEPNDSIKFTPIPS